MSTHTSHKSVHNVKIVKVVMVDFVFVCKFKFLYFTTGTAGLSQPQPPKIKKKVTVTRLLKFRFACIVTSRTLHPNHLREFQLRCHSRST